MWTQLSSLPNQPEIFQVIVKSCSKTPCIVDLDMPQFDEMIFNVSQDTKQLILTVDRINSTFGVVVCAVNGLGRNCTTSHTIVPENISMAPITNRTFIIWVVILCVVLFLLCLLLLIILLLCLYCCGRDQMRTYYPSMSINVLFYVLVMYCLQFFRKGNEEATEREKVSEHNDKKGIYSFLGEIIKITAFFFFHFLPKSPSTLRTTLARI